MTASTAIAFKSSLPKVDRHRLTKVLPLGTNEGVTPSIYVEAVCVGNLVYIRDDVRHLQMVNEKGDSLIFPNHSEAAVFKWLDEVCSDNMEEIANFFLGKSNASRYLVVVKKLLSADGELTFTFTIQHIHQPVTH